MRLRNLAIVQNENLSPEEKLREFTVRGKAKQEAEERLRKELFGDESENKRITAQNKHEVVEEDNGAGVGLHLSKKGRDALKLEKREKLQNEKRKKARGKALEVFLRRDEEDRERMTDDMVAIAQVC